MVQYMRFFAYGVFSVLCLTACYRIPVQQGNIMPAQAVARIQPGMPIQQVTQLLGTPVLVNPFADDQMLYIYTFKSGLETKPTQRLGVYTRNDRVVSTHILS
ncbi:MAG: hypothetical protein A3J38_10755 [Gammaproteobacteria bacterium RIFCSPHIGHO2_12_FULL_45_9]|nr:MAG: hypothetical protein A3J38_10755 [Gammaproteobacteria bacterium RIFCSPHIGHO2_12_FULL_45_9]